MISPGKELFISPIAALLSSTLTSAIKHFIS